MNILTRKRSIKIISLLLALMLLTMAICPSFVYASDEDEDLGGKLFRPIFQMFAGIGDLVIKGLQYFFIGVGDIRIETAGATADEGYSTFNIRYGPAVIFSNIVPGLDANFIKPKYDSTNPYNVMKNSGYTYNQTYTNKMADYKSALRDTNLDGVIKVMERVLDTTIDKNALSIELRADTKEHNESEVLFYYTSGGTKHCMSLWNGKNEYQKYFYRLMTGKTDSNATYSKTYSYDEFISSVLNQSYTEDSWWSGTKTITGEETFKNFINAARSSFSESKSHWSIDDGVKKIGTKESVSATLQPRIFAYYKMLRAIAFVGLLSVLVYVGIRIIISSTGQEKAKYKKMIGDWLAAICILFVLQFIMTLTMTAVESLLEVFSFDQNIIGENGEDVLMTSVRNKIGLINNKASIGDVFVDLIIYLALVVYTGLFTVHYLKRLIYLAFFTMIAPLIALTYPLDKIKDGQAQAFGIWIKEYIFNALLPVMHILLYYIFIGWGIDLANENPLLALVSIGFLIPAEKFFRKMFGFDKASTAGQLGAAAGGAMVMNAINKISQASKTQEKESKDKQPRVNGNSGYIPIEGDVGNSNAPSNRPGEPSQPLTPNPINQNLGNPNSDIQNPGDPNSGIQNPGDPNSGAQATENLDPEAQNNEQGGDRTLAGMMPEAINVGNSGRSHDFNFGAGLKNAFSERVNRKTLKNGGKKLIKKSFKGVSKLAGAAALGTFGLAAGIATGDLSKTAQFTGTAAMAGTKFGDNMSNKGLNAGKTVWNAGTDFKKGAMGDEYDIRKNTSILKDTPGFNAACKRLGVDANSIVRDFMANGVNDTDDIKNALIGRQAYCKENSNGNKPQYSLNEDEKKELIAITKINQTIGDSVWQNPESRKKVFKDIAAKTSPEVAERVQKTMIKMRNI